MLNRIYIVVGVLAIFVLAGAFLVPRFVQWGDYRDRMEDLASGVLGAEVTIRGDIGFSLLPTPRLEFSDVVVGDIESPAATVAAVEAEFALLDFLRDNYNVTALTLNQPRVELVIDENGLFSSGIDIAGHGAGVALGQARIANGSVRLTDLRAETVLTASRIDGEFRLGSFSGPFQFAGNADYAGQRYEVRFNTAASDAEGLARMSATLREVGNAFSASAEGILTSGLAPKFDGTMTYRQAPPRAENANDIRGNLVVESNVAVSTDRAVVSGFTLTPDENRAATRLTGTANVQFGARTSFDAVVSGGVFALPPRDATEVPGELPYEFVRMLSELPAPPLPPIEGTLDIDLAEATLRGFALRDIRIDASTDGSTWRVEQAIAHLPGETELRLSGAVSNDNGKLGFAGDVGVTSRRLDALAALWRRAQDNNPLFNQSGTLEGRLKLGSDALGLSGGRFTFAGQSHGLDMRIGFGEEPRLDGMVKLAALTASQTAAIQALLPDARDTNFVISFPNGSVSLSAVALDLLGLPANDLVAEAQWSPETLQLTRLATSDWGGVSLNGTTRFSGTVAAPHLTGSGQLGIAEADAPGLELLYEIFGVPFEWQQGLAGSWPADLRLTLADADSAPAQVLTLGGTLGAGELDLRAEIANGIAGLATSDVRLIASLEAADAFAAQQQLGFGDAAVFTGAQPLMASLFVEGSGVAGLQGRAAISQGGQSLSYFGDASLSPSGALGGQGTLEIKLDPGAGLASLAGASGASIGAVDATAAISFDGFNSVALEDISGLVGDASIAGNMLIRRPGQQATITGSLRADVLDAGGIAAALFGTEALLAVADGPWPEGPLATATEPRTSRGDIALVADRVRANGADIFERTSLNFSWDASNIALKNLEAQVGGGTLALSLSQCCAGALTDRTITGRLSLSGVDLDAIAPGPVAGGLSGTVDGGVQFESTGPSLAEAMRVMTGEGNFSIAGLQLRNLSPDVFPSIATIDDPLNTDAETLETLVSLGLSQGNFTADLAQGAFTIAGGTARVANLIVEGQGGRLAGGLNVILGRLGLDGSFVLTPRDYVDPIGLIQPDTARILARITGTVAAPQVALDLAEMVAAIQVRANELELDRLEALRLEDEERQRNAAQARNRLIEEQQRQRAAQEAARLAAEQETLRLQQERQQQQTPPPPLSLDFSPQVNQPIGNGVNQPF